LANRHMPIELFYELIPFLRYTDLVYLQGWGEPLVHKDLFEMVRSGLRNASDSGTSVILRLPENLRKLDRKCLNAA
jgi:hypothetical protein